MNDRIHAYLDGELPLEALTEAEIAEVLAFEQELGTVTASLRAVAVPDLSARVMASLPAQGPRPRPWARAMEGLREALWSVRTFTVTWRPAYALGGVAAMVGLLSLWPAGAGGPITPSAVTGGNMVATTTEAERPALYVQFRLDAPEADRVELAGSFTGWTPEYELVETAEGVWTALIPLEPGVHDYTFVINGEQWVLDPYAPQVDDDFGGSNNRLFLPQPDQV